MVTLKDVAAACGTSIATVSYVLSGRGEERRISAAMQERVVKVARELGYDLTARARKSRRPSTAVYWPQKQFDSFLPSFISGMNTALGVAPIQADVTIRPYDPGRLSEQSSLWLPGRAGASVIVSASNEDLETLKQRQTTYPAVLLNRTVAGYPSVTIDEVEAGQMAAEYAAAQAGERITLVLPDKWLLGAQYRSLSVQETLRRCGLQPHACYSCGLEIDDGYSLGQKLLLEGGAHGVFLCMQDTVALGLSLAFRDGGLVMGRDAEIITMSNSYQSANTRLYESLTVVDLRQVEVSICGINLALEMATHAGIEPRQTVLHPVLVPHR